MAVSHQWYIQWSAPSGPLSEINSHFQSINHDWNSGVDWTDSGIDFDDSRRDWPDHGAWIRYKYKWNSRRHEWPTEDQHWPDNTPGWGRVKDPEEFNYPYSYNAPEHSNSPKMQKHRDYSKYPFRNKKVKKYKYEYDNYDESSPTDFNERTRLTGITLWLTMLGLARPQAVPADLDTPPFATLYKWKEIDFEFPSPKHRVHAVASGNYVAANVLPLGLEVWGSRVFVTLPNWRRGIPATLATVPRNGGLASPQLKPYPNWDFHNAFKGDINNCTGLTSVFRINADHCGRLWVLDSGKIDSVDSPKQICPPSVVVFDLSTDKQIARYVIPKKYVLQDSLFSNIIVDTRIDNCADLHVYIADTWRFGLIVFRESDQRFWRFSHHLFYPDPLASNYTLHGLNFQWADGIFGLALSPISRLAERTLYFHSMSSFREFSVSTAILQQPARVNGSASEFHLVGEDRGPLGQASASAIDRRGVMFYGLVTRDSVGCWDTKKPHLKKTIGTVVTNSETLVFPNDIKVDQDNQQSVWVISNKLPMYQARRLDSDDYNYRLLYADTVEAVKGSTCDPEVKMVPKNTPIIQRGWLP